MANGSTMAARKYLMAAVGLVVGACTYRGGDDPATLKFTWFSFLAGDDIRAECAAGSGERYRLVYNAVYTEQVRIYDVRLSPPKPDGGLWPDAGAINVHVRGGGGDLGHLNAEGGIDLLGPWRGTKWSRRLSHDEAGRLRSALRVGGLFEPPPTSLELPSTGFYWIAAACADGRFHANAWAWPSVRFDQAAFPAVLFALDASGVPVNPPRPNSHVPAYPDAGPSESRRDPPFSLRMGHNGLVGVGRLF
jgi:hypothetical protein